MKILTWEDFLRSDLARDPLAAAVGVFDGLHIGHMALIHEVLARDMVKGIVTFSENPKKTLKPQSFHGDIFTLDQRLETLSELGLDLCVLIDFSGDFSKLAGKNFLSLLRDRGNLRFLAVGADFRCGYRLDIGAQDIRSYYDGLGIETRIIAPLLWADRPVSSSRIRKAILDGRLGDARSMLGREYELDLRRARASSEGGKLFLELGHDQVAPPDGLYEAELVFTGERFAVEAIRRAESWSVDFPAPGDVTARPDGLRLMRWYQEC
jgi:riboflavin kinase / FMN adenylyltransferase